MNFCSICRKRLWSTNKHGICSKCQNEKLWRCKECGAPIAYRGYTSSGLCLEHAMKKGLTNMSLEKKKLWRKNQRKGSMKKWGGASDEDKKRWRKSNSNSKVKMWKEMSLEKREQRGKILKESWRNKTSEEKKQHSSYLKECWENLSEERKKEWSVSCRKAGIKRWENITLEEREEFIKSHLGERASNWQGGISFEPYGIEFTSFLKNKIRDREHNRCALCGKYCNFYKLAVHHIDYDKKNNEDINLIALCLSCHPKTNYNRSIWQKHFEDIQYIRYKVWGLYKEKQVA